MQVNIIKFQNPEEIFVVTVISFNMINMKQNVSTLNVQYNLVYVIDMYTIMDGSCERGYA